MLFWILLLTLQDLLILENHVFMANTCKYQKLASDSTKSAIPHYILYIHIYFNFHLDTL